MQIREIDKRRGMKLIKRTYQEIEKKLQLWGLRNHPIEPRLRRLKGVEKGEEEEDEGEDEEKVKRHDDVGVEISKTLSYLDLAGSSEGQKEEKNEEKEI